MRKNILSGIYCIENLINHKKYIGQSVDIQQRWCKHLSELKNNNHDNDYLQNSWNKYGETSFEFFVLEYCENELLDEREAFYIEYYNTLDRSFGYNLKSGGQASNHVCDEIKEKLSESVKLSYQNSDLKQVRSLDALNQWSNPDIKQKIMGENNGMYGKHHTDEARQKMRQNRTGKKAPRIPVICIELNQTFQNMAQASNQIECSHKGISRVCNGKQETCGGYHWKFIGK